METRKLTDDEIAQNFGAVKPLFDKHDGNPEAAKKEIRKAFAGKGYPADLQHIFYCAVDVLARILTESRKERHHMPENETERRKEHLKELVDSLDNERDILLIYRSAKALTSKEVPHRAGK